MNLSNNKGYAYAAAVLAVIFWAGNFVVARLTQFDASILPFSLAFSRWIIALLIMVPLALPISKDQFVLLKKIPITVLLCSFLGVFGFSAFTYIAAQNTSSINLSIIGVSTPFFVTLISWLLRHRTIDFQTIIGLCVCALGVLIVLSNGKFDTFTMLRFSVGDLWMLCAAFSWGAYTALLDRKPIELKTSSFLFATTFLGTIMLLAGYIYEVKSFGHYNLNTSNLLVIVYLGVFVSMIGYYLWNFSTKTLGAVKTGSIYFLIPVFTACLATLSLNEPLRVYHFIGFFFVVSGILSVRVKKNDLIIAATYLRQSPAVRMLFPSKNKNHNKSQNK